MTTALDAVFCDPFRAWNRLEPRCRREDFAGSLRCEVHDGMWMLARQWQFGEFKGEDTGSPILVRALLESTRITRVRLGEGAPIPYDGTTVPLEAAVERLPHVPDVQLRLELSQWLLEALVAALDAEATFDRATYLAAFQGFRPLVALSEDLQQGTIPDAVQRVLGLSCPDLQAWLHIARRTGFDGWKVFVDLTAAAASGTHSHVFNQLQGLPPEHEPKVILAFEDFVKQVSRCYPDLALSRATSWNAKQLEYQFSCVVPEAQGDNAVLNAEEFFSGRLEWYSCDIQTSDVPEELATPDETERQHVTSQVQSLLPAAVHFVGMPASRWWEFEDGALNFSDLPIGTSDVLKIVMAEFALVYGNNWFVVPFPVPVGSLARPVGLVVTDVFGQRTLVEPVQQGSSSDWAGWGLFNLAKLDAPAEQSDTRLFLPPALADVIEGEPLEDVFIVRDEMANLVWAIEAKIPDRLGEGMDGQGAAVRSRAMLSDEVQRAAVADDAALKYTVGGAVPENWIPFIPVHKPDGERRAIEFQRASMPRLIRGEYVQVRPRTDLLRPGLEEGTILPDPQAEAQQTPYFINEEEMPKVGIRIRTRVQRARWLDGRVATWIGRTKTIGRGQASSGLRYDLVERMLRGGG